MKNKLFIYLIFASVTLLTHNTSKAQALHWVTQPKSDVGTIFNESIQNAKISANGRYISFLSRASNIVDGDTNQERDLFVYDQLNGGVQRVNTLSNGLQTNAFVTNYSKVTSNGSLVAFLGSIDLGAGLVNGLFTKNLITGEIVKVSIDGNGNDIASILFSNLILADDGSHVVFSTRQSLDPRHTTNTYNIYQLNLSDQSFELLSLSEDNSEASNQDIRSYSTSANGRYLVFSTNADNLISNAAGNYNVFLRDKNTSTLQLVTVQPSGDPSTYNSNRQSRLDVSNAGTVAYAAANDDLITNDSNDRTDLFLFDSGSNVRINLDTSGNEFSNANIESVLINATGSSVVFSSSNTHVAEDTNSKPDIYVYNTNTGDYTRLTNDNSTNGFVNVVAESVSANGQQVLITSNLREFNGITSAGSGLFQELFSYDLTTGTSTLISPVAFNPNTLIGGSQNAWFSDDQRYALITSRAANFLETLQTDDFRDVFLLDRETDERNIVGRNAFAYDLSGNGRYAVLVSRYFQPAGTIDLGIETLFLYNTETDTYTQIASADYAQVNNDGKVIYVTSVAAVAEDDNDFRDIYLFDPSDNSISLVSKSLSGNAGNAPSTFPDISNSGTGTWLSFTSTASDLVNADINNRSDVFMVNWPSGTITRASQTPAAQGGNGSSFQAKISSDGAYVGFLSYSDNLVDNVSQAAEHVYVYERATQNIELATQDENAVPLDIEFTAFDLSNSGRYVSLAGDTTGFPGDTDEASDVFLKDLDTQSIELISKGVDGTQYSNQFGIPQIVENAQVSPVLIGVGFFGSGPLTGIDAHPGSSEFFLYQQGGPNVELDIEVLGLGSVDGTQGISCMSSCNSNYPLGTELTLVASPESGYVFDRWSSSRGQCSDDTNPCVLRMDRSKQIQALFINTDDIIFNDGFE